MDIFNKSEKPKTELDILQEQRDLKRRRAAYRGKRVHTDRKSYIEVSVTSTQFTQLELEIIICVYLGLKRSS